MNNSLVLCSTLHDSDGGLLSSIDKSTDFILKNCRSWVVSVTRETNEAVKQALLEKGVVVTVEDEKPLVKDKIEANHLNVLRVALEKGKELGVNRFLYADGDRVLMVATEYPKAFEELSRVVTAEVSEDKPFYLNIRRTAKDHFEHHAPLVQTEFEFNRIVSEIWERPIDIGSTLHGISREVVEEILRRSPEMMRVSFPHIKWMVIAREMNAQISSIEIPHVGAFEAPEQSRNKVETRTGKTFDNYEELRGAFMKTLGVDLTLSPREWGARFELYRQYVEFLRTELSSLGLDEKKAEKIRIQIDGSLASMREKEKTVLQRLGNLESRTQISRAMERL